VSKKQTLLDRLNNGMTAVDLPPGVLTQYKYVNKTNRILFIGSSTYPANIVVLDKMDFYQSVQIETGAYLLYLGITTLGPRGIFGLGPGITLMADTIFAHQFYYGEKTVYLMISSPDRYYTEFRRYFTRVDNKNNLCK